MANIVIDLSKKFSGFILFKSLFYKLENEGSIFFANNPATVDDVDLDMKEIKEKISSFLFNKGVNKWNIILIVDMNQQEEKPLEASLSYIINIIRKNIIEKLSHKYTFNTLYILTLDSLIRDELGKPVNPGVRLSMDIDIYGYPQKSYGLLQDASLFTGVHLSKMDEDWQRIKEKNIKNNQRKGDRAFSLFQEVTDSFDKDYFSPVIEMIKSENEDFYHWYLYALEKSREEFIKNFKELLDRVDMEKSNEEITSSIKNIEDKGNSFSSFIEGIENPVNILKQCLKNNIALAGYRNTIIFHMNFNNRMSDISFDNASYRFLLEVIAVIILISTKDMKKILPGNDITRNANWKIKANLDENKLSQIYYSYLSKLKTEKERLGKFVVADIEYEEYTPMTFNFSKVMEKPKITGIPRFSVYYKENDQNNIRIFADRLYDDYEKALEHSYRRMRDLSASLRIQKEGSTGEITKKAGVLEVEYIIKNFESRILEEQKKLISFKEDIELEDKKSIKEKYDDFVEKANEMSIKRPRKSEVIIITILIFAAGMLVYPLWYRYSSFNYQSVIFALGVNIILFPLVLLIENIKGKRIKKQLDDYVEKILKDTHQIVGKLYDEDKNVTKYISDIYNLMMMKKYVVSCKEKLEMANKKITRFNYHKKNLKSHIEVGEIVVNKLRIKKPEEYLDTEKLNLELDYRYENNKVYCPLEYTELFQEINNRININNQAEHQLNSSILGFVGEFAVEEDKEYNHD